MDYSDYGDGGEEEEDLFEDMLIPPKRTTAKRAPIKRGEDAVVGLEEEPMEDVRAPAQLLSLKGLNTFYTEKVSAYLRSGVPIPTVSLHSPRPNPPAQPNRTSRRATTTPFTPPSA